MIIETPRLAIRNWQEKDREAFYRLNSDEKIMAFFPARRSPAEANRMFDRNCNRIKNTRFGFYALEQKDNGTIAGFAALMPTDIEPFIPKGTVEIGWRLLPEHWHKGFATEAARALLSYGFDILKLDEIVSFAVQDNLPSIAVMQRIGMTAEPEHNFDHPRVPDSMPHLKRHVLFRIKNPKRSD